MNKLIIVAFWILIISILSLGVWASIISEGWESDCTSGVCVDKYYMGRQFYFENSTWKAINNTFYYNGTHWVADKNNLKVYIRDNIVTLKGENESVVTFTIPSAINPILFSVAGDTVTYNVSTKGAVVMSGVLTLTLTSEGLEKLLRIDSLSTSANKPWDYLESINKTLSKSRFLVGDLKIWYVMSNSTDVWNVYYPTSWTESSGQIGFSMNKSWFLNAVFPIFVDPTIVYNFTVVNSNKASYATTGGSLNPAWATGWAAGTNASAAQYTNMSSPDGIFANVAPSNAQAEPWWRFEMRANDVITVFDWLRVRFTGSYTTNGEVAYCYIANFSSSVWNSFGTMSSSNANITVNYTNVAVNQVRNSTSGVVSVYCIGDSFDAGESINVDYFEVMAGYTVNVPSLSDNMTNSTQPLAGDSVNFSISISSVNANVSGYIFSWNASGADCDTWANSTFTSTSGTSVNAWNISIIPAACTGKNIGWMFYANNTAGWNQSAVYNLYVGTNVAPSITALSFDDDTASPPNEIDLAAGSTKSVLCNGTVDDPNGYSDIDAVSAVLYASGNGTLPTDPENNNTLYKNASCTLSAGYSTTKKDFNCSFLLYYYAQNGTWTCNATVNDTKSESATLSVTSKVNNLIAINISSMEINYGNLAPGATSPSSIVFYITNFGNTQIDLSLNGTNMSCGAGMIIASAEHYNITGTDQAYAQMRALSNSEFLASDFNLDKKVTSNSNRTTYWRIQVPQAVKGSCTGIISISAQQG
jgi:hypothetical protein